MNRTIHKICVWSVVVMLPLLGVGMILARIFPPASPGESAIELARYYANHEVRIQIGLVIAALSWCLTIPFFGAIAWETQKMTGGRRTLASTIQVMCGTILYTVVIVALMMFMAASFRADRSPEVVQALHDLAWIAFIAPVGSGVVEFLLLGITVLMDEQETPSFPRWFGYVSLFLGVDFAGAAFVVLTETGPFAWNGALAYYLPLGTFFLWLMGALFFLLRSIDREWAVAR